MSSDNYRTVYIETYQYQGKYTLVHMVSLKIPKEESLREKHFDQARNQFRLVAGSKRRSTKYPIKCRPLDPVAMKMKARAST